jgi:hypothetical protein
MEVVKSKLMEMKNINIGVGLGSLKFGIYTIDVEEELGNPSEAEKNEDEGENWHYDDYDMSMSFDEDSRLVTIAVSDESYLLEGVSLIGKDVEFVEEQVKSMNLGEAFHEEMSEGEDGGISVLGFEDSSMNLWFEDGILTEIQFWPLFKDEDTIVWPV